jgi:hypothetical protein
MTQTPLEKFEDVCVTCSELFAEKNAQYGNTIVKTGVLGASVELIGAVSRLPQMVLKSPAHGRNDPEKLRDVLMDIHNYATIALMMMTDYNWEGE